MVTNVSDHMKLDKGFDSNLYEPFNLSIEHFGLEFFQSMRAARNFTTSHCKASLLEISKSVINRGIDAISPFSLNLLLGMRKKKVKDPEIAKLRMSGSLTEIKIRVTPQLYNDLVNIDECFKIDEDENWEQLLSSKNEIIRLASKISQVKRRSYFVWENSFAVMNGGYIYFYDS